MPANETPAIPVPIRSGLDLSADDAAYLQAALDVLLRARSQLEPEQAERLRKLHERISIHAVMMRVIERAGR